MIPERMEVQVYSKIPEKRKVDSIYSYARAEKGFQGPPKNKKKMWKNMYDTS